MKLFRLDDCHIVCAELTSHKLELEFPGRLDLAKEAEIDQRLCQSQPFDDIHETANCMNHIIGLLRSGVPVDCIRFVSVIAGASNAPRGEIEAYNASVPLSSYQAHHIFSHTANFLEAILFHIIGLYGRIPDILTAQDAASVRFDRTNSQFDLVELGGVSFLFPLLQIEKRFGMAACTTCSRYFNRWPGDRDRYGKPYGSGCVCRGMCGRCERLYSRIPGSPGYHAGEYCSDLCADQAEGALIEHDLVMTKHRGSSRGPASRLTGVEIELSGGDASAKEVNAWIRKWGAGTVPDGSIDSDGEVWGGIEIVTPPASGEKLVEILTELDSALISSKANVNKSCGLHVHVDGGKLSWRSIENFCRLWCLVEDEMFKLVAKTRRTNTYCKPFAPFAGEIIHQKAALPGPHALAMKKALARSLYGAPSGEENCKLKEAKAHKYDCARYSAVNLHSWIYRGTIEFRLHHGTTKMLAKVLPWVKICRAIVHYSACMTDEMLSAVSRSPEKLRFIMTYFKDLSTADWIPDRMAQLSNRAGAIESGE